MFLGQDTWIVLASVVYVHYASVWTGLVVPHAVPITMPPGGVLYSLGDVVADLTDVRPDVQVMLQSGMPATVVQLRPVTSVHYGKRLQLPSGELHVPDLAAAQAVVQHYLIASPGSDVQNQSGVPATDVQLRHVTSVLHYSKRLQLPSDELLVIGLAEMPYSGMYSGLLHVPGCLAAV